MQVVDHVLIIVGAAVKKLRPDWMLTLFWPYSDGLTQVVLGAGVMPNNLATISFVSTIIAAPFLCISALSLLNQINFFEGVITLSRYIIAFIAAFNLYFLFVNNKNLLYLTFSLISVLLLYQVLRAFGLLKTNLLQMTYAEMILAVKYNHSNKNIFSSVILLKLPLILYCSYLSTGYKKIFHMVSFTLALLLLFILSTRALMIGAVFMIAFFVITSAKHALTSKRLRIALISMVVVFSGIYSLINYTTRKQTVDKQSSALNGASMKLRFHFWEGALEEIKEKPVLGCGIGNWKIHTLKYESQWRTTTSVSVHAHNDFLQVTAESGLIAGLSFLLFFISLAYISFKNFKTTQDKTFKLLSVVLIMTTFGYCVDSFFNFPIARATPIVVLMLVSILIIVLSTTRDQEVQNKPYAFVIFGFIFFLGPGTI